MGPSSHAAPASPLPVNLFDALDAFLARVPVDDLSALAALPLGLGRVARARASGQEERGERDCERNEGLAQRVLRLSGEGRRARKHAGMDAESTSS